jgi:hypothetical protein
MNFSQIEINNLDFRIENSNVYHYRNEDNFRINIFIFEANRNTINDNWKRFSSMVAANYQNSNYMSEKEFDRWNFYIIYISKDAISKELKNKIYELEQSIINLKKEKKEKIDKCIEELIKNIDFEYKEKVVDIQDQIEKIKTSIYLKDFQN